MSSQTIVEQYNRMRLAGVPIIVANTPDSFSFPEAIMEGVAAQVVAGKWGEERTEREKTVAYIGWDGVRGLFAHNDAGIKAVSAVSDQPSQIGGLPDIVLKKLANAPRNTVVFMLVKQEWLQDPIVRQGIGNLRDQFKRDRRTLVLVGQELMISFELTGDVLFLDEQLPPRETIRETIDNTLAMVSFECDPKQVAEAVEALAGLTLFQVEQLVAINITQRGINTRSLWDAKKRIIGQTPGLSMFEGEETFDDLVGLANIKQFITRLLDGPNRPNAVVFIDELEKSMSTSTNDSSGVSLDQLQNVLTEMTDTDAAGMLLFGVPGVGKSAIAKATGRQGNIPTLKLDFGGAKGSHVGQSEGQIRTALKKIRAISSGKTLWIATCNSVARLPAELRSRFSFGSFFFDIPGAVQRGELWGMYTGKFDLPKQAVPTQTKNWTGREVRNCCRLARDMGIKLSEAAEYVVPIIESAADVVKSMRDEANGCFLDADQPGKYMKARPQVAKNGKRDLSVYN